MKESGILMPVSALPSRTGIGELGAQTREFLKLLRENKVTIWQILPLNPVGSVSYTHLTLPTNSRV